MFPYNIDFDNNVSEADSEYAISVFNNAYNNKMSDSMPWGYVYRSIYADGHTYVGKRKIYPHTDWMHYVGSGAKLDKSLVIRKEFICFGMTSHETHELECKYIQQEIDNADSRDMVLNIHVNVVDRNEYMYRDTYNEIINKYGIYIILDVYVSSMSITKTAEYFNCSKRYITKFIKSIGLEPCQQKRYFPQYKNINGVLYHYHDYSYNCNIYGIICEICGEVFESKHKDAKYCSKQCISIGKMVIKPYEYNNIKHMLSEGKSLSEIGLYYNTNAKVVSDYMKYMGLHETIARSDTGIADSESYKNEGKWNMHMRWHVRGHKPNPEKCEYCKNNDGFNDDDIVKAKDRVQSCMNPLCSNTFISQKGKYCSEKCESIMKKYASMYAEHISHHENKNKYYKYCWFCENNIHNKSEYDALNKETMMNGCDRMIKRRNGDVIKLYNSGKSVKEIVEITGISKFTIRRIIK